MPQLPSYDNTITPQQPGDLGAESFISAARRIGPLEHAAGEAMQQGAEALGKSLGNIYQQRENAAGDREVLQLASQSALMQADHTKQWNALTASTDPNNLDAAARSFVQDTLLPDSQNFIAQAKTERGRVYAQRAMDEYQGHAVNRMFADSAKAAGDAAVTNLTSTKNTLAGNALRDPATIDQGIATWNGAIDAMKGNPNLDQEQRSKLEALKRHGAGEIAAAGLFSGIEADPTGSGLARLESGKYSEFLTGEQEMTLRNHADVVSRARLLQQRMDESEGRRVDKEAMDQELADLTTSTIDPATGNIRLPDDYMQRVLRLPSMAGAKDNPAAVREALNFGRSIIAEQAKGTPTATNPATYQDFSDRMFRPSGDPQQLTAAELFRAKAQGRLSDKDFAFFHSAINAGAKNPEAVEDERQFKNYLTTVTQPGGSNPALIDPQAKYTFEQAKRAAFYSGRSAGTPAKDLLDPQSKSFIGFPSKDELSNAAVAPVQRAAPATLMQKAASDAVDIATQVDNLGRNNAPEAVNEILKDGGVNIDVRNNAWCAALVNSALKQAGIQGTGSQLASSFKDWGFAVDAGRVQKGDVFYVPSEGYTGHVGFATGQTRQGPGGQLQVQVVSSHKQGNPDNPGGIEWRDARGMIFRRAKPSLETIMTQRGFISRAFDYLVGTGPEQTEK